ncbi:helix-turn-helix domain-containing protein [Actinotalea ferrariae]|uniref:helix-turn-helix domain-containing protein n=1 Tax=Actinotalea ferrariae TaxID=1386098 RepID=UPI001C8B712E|nr:helix-turn-helix domain-containing protein [Actinotalea ferrariae]MBX9245852.1 helix-turn-helix domain-containing protein [Actinotalea ferrariae]
MAIQPLDGTRGTRPEPARRFYRVKEAAAVLGIPQRTLYHLAETEQIPCRRLGNVILLPKSWVESDAPPPRRR